jgi:antibiotic biosynthesis monooxygenase
MYASIRRAKGKPGATAEITQKVRDGFVPITSQVPGFVAYYLVDLGDDSVMTVSIFKDKAGAEESGRRAADWVKENLAPLMAAPLEILVGEVAVHKAA